jgi:hypothetical protein
MGEGPSNLLRRTVGLSRRGSRDAWSVGFPARAGWREDLTQTAADGALARADADVPGAFDLAGPSGDQNGEHRFSRNDEH